jgi:hypothetical protein
VHAMPRYTMQSEDPEKRTMTGERLSSGGAANWCGNAARPR